jgi:IS5 family transposase
MSVLSNLNTSGSGENREKDANSLKRGKKTFFGYKAHIGIYSKSEIIRNTDFTPANVHDSDMFNHLINGKETAILADKDYANER